MSDSYVVDDSESRSESFPSSNLNVSSNGSSKPADLNTSSLSFHNAVFIQEDVSNFLPETIDPITDTMELMEETVSPEVKSPCAPASTPITDTQDVSAEFVNPFSLNFEEINCFFPNHNGGDSFSPEYSSFYAQNFSKSRSNIVNSLSRPARNKESARPKSRKTAWQNSPSYANQSGLNSSVVFEFQKFDSNKQRETATRKQESRDLFTCKKLSPSHFSSDSNKISVASYANIRNLKISDENCNLSECQVLLNRLTYNDLIRSNAGKSSLNFFLSNQSKKKSQEFKGLKQKPLNIHNEFNTAANMRIQLQNMLNKANNLNGFVNKSSLLTNNLNFTSRFSSKLETNADLKSSMLEKLMKVLDPHKNSFCESYREDDSMTSPYFDDNFQENEVITIDDEDDEDDDDIIELAVNISSKNNSPQNEKNVDSDVLCCEEISLHSDASTEFPTTEKTEVINLEEECDSQNYNENQLSNQKNSASEYGSSKPPQSPESINQVSESGSTSKMDSGNPPPNIIHESVCSDEEEKNSDHSTCENNLELLTKDLSINLRDCRKYLCSNLTYQISSSSSYPWEGMYEINLSPTNWLAKSKSVSEQSLKEVESSDRGITVQFFDQTSNCGVHLDDCVSSKTSVDDLSKSELSDDSFKSECDGNELNMDKSKIENSNENNFVRLEAKLYDITESDKTNAISYDIFNLDGNFDSESETSLDTGTNKENPLSRSTKARKRSKNSSKFKKSSAKKSAILESDSSSESLSNEKDKSSIVSFEKNNSSFTSKVKTKSYSAVLNDRTSDASDKKLCVMEPVIRVTPINYEKVKHGISVSDFSLIVSDTSSPTSINRRKQDRPKKYGFNISNCSENIKPDKKQLLSDLHFMVRNPKQKRCK